MRANFARASALAGAAVWAAVLFYRTSASDETELITKILLLGVLVVVPLGVSLIAGFQQRLPLIYRVGVLLQPIGAIGVLISLLLNEGIAAAIIASAWLVATGMFALFGMWRLRFSELRSAEEISIVAGLVYLPVGAIWLIMSRLGIEPLGFGPTIVLLTAVHFHFAGFAAPILVGLAGSRLPHTGLLRSSFIVVVFSVIAGTPLVAAGITFSPALALMGAIVFSLGLIMLAVLVVGWVVPKLRSIPVQILLVISSLSCLPAMFLACLYAYSLLLQKLIIPIPLMAMTHGVINTFGFVLCGLLSWLLVEAGSNGGG